MGEFIFCLIVVALFFFALFISTDHKYRKKFLRKIPVLMNKKKTSSQKVINPIQQRILDEKLLKLYKQFDEDNRKADINKLILLLKLGANPNQWITVRVDDGMDDDGILMNHLEDHSLLDECKDQAVKELLRAYGAKTTEELNALKREKKAEEERMRCIAEAEQKAKAENDLKKVKNFLSSKNSKA